MDAEDIAHDCFVKILARWDKTDWTNLEQYLSWMLNNCVVNYYNKFGADDNKKSGSELIELIDCGFVKDPFDSLLKQDFRKVLQKSMATLSESEKSEA
ncbi:sigma-70 family RNA polymerase sigma factor, partial [Herbiconiux daphne]